VEIDESKFGKRKHNRGHRVEGVWVVGEQMKEDFCSHCRKQICRSAETLANIIADNFLPG
jgi:hypothetical protein